MSLITAIRHDQSTGRFYIDLDGQYAAMVRESIFPALKVAVGQEISLDELMLRERQAFAMTYQAGNGAAGRLNRVQSFIESIDPQIAVLSYGGELAEKNTDLRMHVRGHPERPFMFIVVSGSDKRHGTSYWLRPSKLKFWHKHPNFDVWAILAYRPDEELVFLRLNAAEHYP